MPNASRNTLLDVKNGSGSLALATADEEKFHRTEDEWCIAVISYLMFRAGTEWRRSKPRYRKSPEYSYYLAGIRMMQRIRDVDPSGCTCAYCLPAREDRAAKKAELGRLIEEQISVFERSQRKPPRSATGAEIAAAPLRLAMD